MVLALDHLFNPISPRKNRIGVFGPYINNGPEIIQDIMKFLSSKGFCAITGEYYLRPKTQNFKKVNELCPDFLRTLKDETVPPHKWLHELPRLVSKSIVYLTNLRGQGNEIEGCGDYDIPMLGFILTDEITRERNVCHYLMVEERYSRCTCPSPEFCDRIVKPFCPFYDSVHIPWSIKRLFLSSNNMLIAVKSLEDLKPLIDKFVEGP